MRKQAVALVCFFGIFAMAATVGEVLIARTVSRQSGTVNYVPVSAVVTRSKVIITHGKSTSYRAQIDYRFTVAGTPYQSTRTKFTGSVGGEAASNAMVAAHPVGSPITAYYDPASPDRAVLIRGLGREDYIIVGAMLPLLAIPVGWFAFLFEVVRPRGQGERRFSMIRAWPDGDITRVRLRANLHAWLMGVGVFGGMGILSLIAVALTPIGASIDRVIMLGAVLAALGLVVALLNRRPIIRGDWDILIDPLRMVLTIPRGRTKSEPVQVPLQEVSGVEVIRGPKPSKGAAPWLVNLRTDSGGPRFLTQFGGQTDAHLFAAWLRVELGLPAGG